MTYKLNSLKTFQDRGIFVCMGMILAFIMMLLPVCWGNSQAESETETAGTAEVEFPFAITSNNKFCEEEIAQELRNIKNWIQDREWFMYLIAVNARCDYENEWVERAEESRNAEWYPWKLTEDWDHQEMPIVTHTNWSHEAFKDLANVYWLDASMFRKVENHYWIKEWVILCITIAETSWGNRWYGKSNPWNVGNNDRWDRIQYAFFETWLEKIGQTLTNKNLGRKQTLWCLSNAGSCTEATDNGMRYATSDGSWERNMVACLSTIYWKIDPSSFNIRR